MSPSCVHLDRRALLSGGAGAALAVAGAPTLLSSTATAATRPLTRLRKQSGKLPIRAIERAVQAEGQASDGVLGFDLSRDDIGKVHGPDGVTFDGSFEIDSMLYFQPLGPNRAFFNGCLPVKEREVQGVIDAMLVNGLTFQALHQHFIGMSPQIWFVHWRGVGEPVALASAVNKVLRATSIKLPQTMPKNPRSSLDSKRLAGILHGDAMVGDEGVITVDIDRSDRIVIGDVIVSPQANISTNVDFKPIGSNGRAAAAVDFSMRAREINPVMATMRQQGWFVGCLYNQETDENPQLYFSHMVKIGDAYTLAAEIRAGLDHTNATR